MPQPPSAASWDEPVIRDRGDACPGALRLHAADDGRLARVRIPGGLLTARQASVLALAADRFGDGHLELTSRGNVQLRGLTDDCGAGLAKLLEAAGLLPAPSHERVRNIVATPLSGISGIPALSVDPGTYATCGDPGAPSGPGVSAPLTTHDAPGVSGVPGTAGGLGVSGVPGTSDAPSVSGAPRTPGRSETSGTSGRSATPGLSGTPGSAESSGPHGLSGTPGSSLTPAPSGTTEPSETTVPSGTPNTPSASGRSGGGGGVRADVVPWVRELDRLLCGSSRVVGLSGRFLFALDDGRGDVAALDPDVTVLALPAGRALVRFGAAADAVEVAAPDAPRAALLAAEHFLDAVDSAGTRAWRVAELPAEHRPAAAAFAVRLRAAGLPAAHVPAVDWPYAPPPRPWGSGTGDQTPLCVLPPLGRLSSEQWRVLVEVADRGDGQLRITPWRTVVLPRASTRRPVNGAARIEAAGLVLGPGGPWESVTACTGRPGCAKSLADVRADARAVATASAGALPVHWSGCERRCGHPRGALWVDLVATGPDRYELSAPGRPPAPVPLSDLASALKTARTARGVHRTGTSTSPSEPQ
ncbi:nitrite reductase [Streptomyces sp. NPDC006512]|uniref:nitrite reductase n=1 Tax=Streptomyces sp. NPDC006512 TaxID=3154307 RepID=UPI0033A8A44A